MNAADFFAYVLVLNALHTTRAEYILGFETYDRCDSQCMQCMKDHGYHFYAAVFWNQAMLFGDIVLANMKDAHRAGLGRQQTFRHCIRGNVA